MNKADRDNTLIVMASSGGFPFDGFVSEGYKTMTAYRKTNTITRLLRELCFRLPLLPKAAWYNPDIRACKAEYIIVRDVIITREFLLWLQKNHPGAQINFSYDNMVGKARHLRPEQIPEGIRVSTFDPYDSEKYGLQLRKVSPYYPCYVKKAEQKKYDLLFVGRDKGRGDWLKELQKYLEERGIRTKFLITADGKYSRPKPYYEQPVSYDQLTDWVAESRALLNIGMENQQGTTMRDIESYFNQIRLVTTNTYFTHSELYDKENTFFLTNDNWEDLVTFLKQEYVKTHEVSWEHHRIEDSIAEITQ